MIDLIVPTIEGREDSLALCLGSYEAHATTDLNPVVIEDSKTCGWGWRKGLEQSSAPYVLLATDDQECIGQGWDEICIESVDEGLLPCPRVWTPGGQIESQGGDMNAYRHIITRPQKDKTPVDYTVIPFMSQGQADAIGMLDIHYSSDVWVSYRGRSLGYSTVLRHGFDVVHHHALPGRGAGMSQSERDAMDGQTMREELERCAS